MYVPYLNRLLVIIGLVKILLYQIPFFMDPVNQIENLEYIYIKVDGFCSGDNNCSQELYTHYCFMLNKNTLVNNQIDMDYSVETSLFEDIIVRVWNFDLATVYNQSIDGVILGKHLFISDQLLFQNGQELSNLLGDYVYISIFDVTIIHFDKEELILRDTTETNIYSFPTVVTQIPLTGSKTCVGDMCTAKTIVSLRLSSPVITKLETETLLDHFKRIGSDIGGIQSLLTIVFFSIILNVAFFPCWKCCNCPNYQDDHCSLDMTTYDSIVAHNNLNDTPEVKKND